MNVRKIEIYRAGENDWAVCWDGQRVTRLCWDEMLGQVARLTMNGRPIYRDPIPEAEWFWKWGPKMLCEKNP